MSLWIVRSEGEFPLVCNNNTVITSRDGRQIFSKNGLCNIKAGLVDKNLLIPPPLPSPYRIYG